MIILHQLSDDVCGLRGVVTLIDDITDLLVCHDEVDAVSREDQERVVSVLQLHETITEELRHTTHTLSHKRTRSY